jgi:hypothetical protein
VLPLWPMLLENALNEERQEYGKECHRSSDLIVIDPATQYAGFSCQATFAVPFVPPDGLSPILL